MALVRLPPELSADPRVRYDAAAARLIYPVSGYVGLLYVVLTLLHPIMVGGRTGWIMAAVAGVSALILLGVAWYARHNHVTEHGTAILSVTFLIMVANSGLHMYLTQEVWQTTNLMLVLIGAGMAVLEARWNIAVTALGWLAWIVAMLQIPQANWPHWVIAMAMSTLVGQLVRYSRRANLDTAASAMEMQNGLLTEAEELAASKQNLLATISHDVRTPVTGIVGMVDLLLQRPLDARTRELVAGVQHSADGLTTLLNNLLDLARVEAGRLEVHKADADVCAMIGDVLQMVGPIAQRKHVPLIGASSPDLDPWLNTDSSRFQQILLNLVSNAVKFTDEGAVTVVARPVRLDGQPWVEIKVTDTGPGMSEQEQAAAFEVFVQGGPAVHRRHGGSGLGLAIAQRLTGPERLPASRQSGGRRDGLPSSAPRRQPGSGTRARCAAGVWSSGGGGPPGGGGGGEPGAAAVGHGGRRRRFRWTGHGACADRVGHRLARGQSCGAGGTPFAGHGTDRDGGSRADRR
jgi:signal transduction histidine kinase